MYGRDADITDAGNGRATTSDAVQEALRDALEDMPKLISTPGSAANRYCQVVRSSVRQRSGRFRVQVAVVPIGGSDLRPEEHGLILRREDGKYVAGACFSRRNWTATFPEVPEGRYDVGVFSLVLDQPARIPLPPGISERKRVACEAPTRRVGVEATRGELRFTARRNEAENSIDVQVATDSPELVGMHCLISILDDKHMPLGTVVSPEPVQEDYWGEGRHGAEPVIAVDEAAISSRLTVQVDPIAVDTAQEETAKDPMR